MDTLQIYMKQALNTSLVYQMKLNLFVFLADPMTYIMKNLDYIATKPAETPQQEITPIKLDALVSVEVAKIVDGATSKAKVKICKCGKKGYYASKCPERQQETSEEVQIRTIRYIL